MGVTDARPAILALNERYDGVQLPAEALADTHHTGWFRGMARFFERAFAALAVSRRIERQTGWSIRKFVKNARRYRTIQIQTGPHTITAADPRQANSGKHSTKSTAHRLRTKLSPVGTTLFATRRARAPLPRGVWGC